MKYLSFILAVSVLLLSAMPCCIEDKCFTLSTEIQNSEDDTCNDCSDNNSDCCSPFFHCNTCTGFPEARYHKPFEIPDILISNCKSEYILNDNLPDFTSSIWQPPQA